MLLQLKVIMSHNHTGISRFKMKSGFFCRVFFLNPTDILFNLYRYYLSNHCKYGERSQDPVH